MLYAQVSAVSPLTSGDAGIVFVRPESVRFADSSASQNQLEVTVVNQEFEGHFWHLVLQTAEGSVIRMSVMNDSESQTHEVGSRISISFTAQGAIALAQGELAAE
jgi:ABC-type Fe3+/spermidine/putrescine transport system ATPase subunit